jgi:hypothetical protein
MAYTPVFSQGVKFIKIARIDEQGNDNTLSLQELDSVRIKYNDVGVVEYPITSIAKYDDYFLFGVAATNITSSADNQILNYRFSASYSNYFLSGSSYNLDNYGDYGSEAYDNLNYFDLNTGRYTLGNQPNVPIRIVISASVTSSSDEVTTILYINSNLNGVVASDTHYFPSGNPRTIMSVSYTVTPQINEYFYLSISPGANTNFTGSFFVTQSTTPQTGSSDLVVLQPFIDADFATSDYNVLGGNAVEARINPFYMDIDYSTNALQAVNIEQILSGSATRATVQQSNYTYASHINGRYNGSKTNSINYNTYTPPTDYTTSSTSIFGYNEPWPGDESYGKQASIDIYTNYFAKFINITSSSPELPGTSKIFITELVDINGNRLALGQDTYTLDVAYNFYKGNNVGIYNITEFSASLATSSSIIDGGAYYQTILYSTGSTSVGVFPTFATFVKSGTGYTNIDGTNNFHSAFTASSPNIISAINSDDPTVLKNWLYGFLTSSFQGNPLSRISILGVYAGIYNTNTNNIINGFPTEENYINYSELITPIQANDYIRIGVTGSSFLTSNPPTSSQTLQITNVYIDPSSDGLVTGSLTLNGNITNLPSPLGQAYIIYRRIPSDSYVIIDKEINSNSTGLIIPANFNPAYDPIKIARDAGVI